MNKEFRFTSKHKIFLTHSQQCINGTEAGRQNLPLAKPQVIQFIVNQLSHE